DHRAAKGAALSYEDEKFAYLLAVREPIFTPAGLGRILDRPDLSKIGLTAKVCRVDGSAGFVTVPKREKVAFAGARRAKWGDDL
ncbi:MAG: SAM-dependent methyltransferase, partial [Rhizobiaceae bacterium]|nr:SAM-dependent methyltransferase [Rhizobiaceae bacterium]